MNSTSNYKLTIVVPIYNEEDNMSEVKRRLCGYVNIASVTTCILFVNDGSKDNSLNLILDICSRNPHCYYLSFAHNAGLSAAIKAGIDFTESLYMGYIDADLQTDPEDFNLLLPFVDQFDLVMGIRANRKDSGFKNLQSKIANNFRRFMTGDQALDTGCPLKIIHTEVAKKLPFFTGMHRFLPALILLEQGSMKQIPVNHHPRVAGVSKYHLWNRLVGPFVDCFAYRWMKKRYIRYQIAQQNINSTAHQQ